MSFRPVPICRTNCVWQAWSCLPVASRTTTKRPAQNSSFVEKSSFASQAMDPDLDRGFSRAKNLRRSRPFCRLVFDSAGFAESLRQKLGRFLPAGIFACGTRLSTGVSPTQRHDKLSFPYFSFFSFFLFEGSVGEALEACLSRFWFDAFRTDLDPPRLINAASRSGDPCRITCQALPVNRNL